MPRKSKTDPNGPDILGDATRLAGQAAHIVRASLRWQRTTRNSTHLRSVSIYPPSSSRNGQWLIIGKAWNEGYRLVAFHRASDLITALAGFFQRYLENKLIWKDDEYAEGGSHPQQRS